MPAITSTTQPIKNCFQTHYSLPTFQREYKWERKHFVELLNDIQDAFLSCFEPGHGRRSVSSYQSYFVGSIITSDLVSGKKPIIDGQQRLTSIFILLSFFEKYVKDNSVEGVQNIKSLLGSLNYGEMDYKIEFSASRKALFDEYLCDEKTHAVAIVELEAETHTDPGDEKIVLLLNSIEPELEDGTKSQLPMFIDYLLEKVEIIEISVPKESEAHKVFVTMNDRGLRLSPIDLLKGKILSQITDRDQNRECHLCWSKILEKLRELGADDESDFFKTYFRAQWAETIRGKTKELEPKDYDTISESYHRWFDDNTTKMGIISSDSYVSFVNDILKKYSDIYAFVRNTEKALTPGFEHIYYNSCRNFSHQTMILLSAASKDDLESTWKSKIKIVSEYIDFLLTTRTIEGKNNRYDAMKELSFNLAKELRGKDKAQLLSLVQQKWDADKTALEKIGDVEYKKADRSEILFLLARIAVYIENKVELQTKTGFVEFWRRDRSGKTFDIEHLLKENYTPNTLPSADLFADSQDYGKLRNNLGALILLGRSRNRSLSDKAYTEKISVYASENILAQTLTTGFYQSNPQVDVFMSSHAGIPMMAIPDFGKSSITDRKNLYIYISKKIWDRPVSI